MKNVFQKYWRFDQKIKREARGRLAGKWGIALGVAFLPLLAITLQSMLSEFWLYLTGVTEAAESAESFVPSSVVISAALSVLAGIAFFFFLLRPIWLGVLRWCADTARGYSPRVSAVLSFFSPEHYMPAIQYSFRRLIRLLLWALATVGTALVLGTGIILLFHLSDPAEAFENFGTAEMRLSSIITYIFSLVIGILAYLLVTLRYFLADYLFVTEGEKSEPMKRSCLLMVGYKAYVWQLMVSFLGWILFCIFIFPILYVGPFLLTALAVTQKWIIYDRLHKVSKADFVQS